MFNLPGQTDQQLLNDIAILREIKADQITFYPLMNGNNITPPSVEKRMYKMICGVLSADYTRSSALTFTKKDGTIDEYIVKYGEYAAVGSGAFGYLGGTLYANTFSINN